VGDAEFQKKCLGKMKDVATGGRTVLFVSHNMGVIGSLCEKTILLNNGKVQYFGNTRSSINKYLKTNISNIEIKRQLQKTTKPFLNLLRIENIDCKINTKITIKIGVNSCKPDSVSLEITLKDHLYNSIAFASLGLLKREHMLKLETGYQEKSYIIDLNQIAKGTYYLTAQIAYPMIEILSKIDPGIQFEVNPEPPETGALILDQNWSYGSFPLQIKEIC